MYIIGELNDWFGCVKVDSIRNIPRTGASQAIGFLKSMTIQALINSFSVSWVSMIFMMFLYYMAGLYALKISFSPEYTIIFPGPMQKVRFPGDS